jgi:ABC-type multidrug transport system ATPase subunit
MFEQTSGTIDLFKKDTRFHMNSLRPLLSSRPQRRFDCSHFDGPRSSTVSDDIIFDLLTVREQLEFHCIARGLKNIEGDADLDLFFVDEGYGAEKDEICADLLESVHLSNDEESFCSNLSVGMKRCLSIACAFLGQTKLFLDDPSSGLDPINPRLLW